MSQPTMVGLLVLALPEVIVLWLVLRRRPALLAFACALLVVGLGYLTATGAAHDVGTWALSLLAPARPAVGR